MKEYDQNLFYEKSKQKMKGNKQNEKEEKTSHPRS